MYASERDEQARQAWREDVQRQDADDLVFVDECGTHLSMTPLFADPLFADPAVCRHPARYASVWHGPQKRIVPRNKGANISLIAAMTVTGMLAALTVEGSVNRVTFETYVAHVAHVAQVAQVLVPELRPGQTVVMDDLSVHKSARVQHLIEACGCKLRFCRPTRRILRRSREGSANSKRSSERTSRGHAKGLTNRLVKPSLRFPATMLTAGFGAVATTSLDNLYDTRPKRIYQAPTEQAAEAALTTFAEK